MFDDGFMIYNSVYLLTILYSKCTPEQMVSFIMICPNRILTYHYISLTVKLPLSNMKVKRRY